MITSSAASPPGQLAPAPSALQNMPKEVSITPTSSFRVFSGTRASGALTAAPTATTTNTASAAAARGEAQAMLVGAHGEHDEGDLQALEQHALEADGERVAVERRGGRARGARRGLGLLLEREQLVVQVLQSRPAQDRLAQPLQPEDQQQPADEDAQRVRAAARSAPGPAQPPARPAPAAPPPRRPARSASRAWSRARARSSAPPRPLRRRPGRRRSRRRALLRSRGRRRCARRSACWRARAGGRARLRGTALGAR